MRSALAAEAATAGQGRAGQRYSSECRIWAGAGAGAGGAVAAGADCVVGREANGG